MKTRLIIAISAITATAVGLGAGSFAWFTSKATSSSNAFQVGTLAIGKTASSDKWAEVNGKPAVLNNLQCGDSRTYTYEFNNATASNTNSTLDLLYKNVMTDLYDIASGNILDPVDNSVLASANAKKADLLNAALFDLTIKRVGNKDGFLTNADTSTGTYKGVISDVNDTSNAAVGQQVVFNAKNLTDLKNILSEERKMAGGALVTDTYTFQITLPQQVFAGTGDDSLTGKSSLAGTEYSSNNNEVKTDNDYQGAPGGFVINTYAAQNTASAAYDNGNTVSQVE